MTHFGSKTMLDDDLVGVALDCFDTLVELDEATYRPRRGVIGFLEYCRDQRGLVLVVLSDAHSDRLRRVLQGTGLDHYFDRLYYGCGAIDIDDEGRPMKHFRNVLADYSITAEQLLFIGDSPLDAEAARRAEIKFIRVPGSADREFGFRRLITGPSGYNSGAYSRKMLGE
ncbi:MAG: HAD family hydrolase [Planctomycetota bacterium]|jgi:FMN phosphatase YigB (HAD superfamily)